MQTLKTNNMNTYTEEYLDNAYLPERRQRSKRIYLGTTRKGRSFIATTSNGANLAGKVSQIIDLGEGLTKNERRQLAVRLAYLAARLWQE